MKARLRQTLLYLIYLAFAVLVPLEFAVRHFIVAGRDYGYLVVEPDEQPFFRLADQYRDKHTTVRDGRREVLPRGARPEAVAFVGDSVTFGTHLPDVLTFVEQLQASQQKFDAYNFGVPGYGLPEIEQVIARVAMAGRYPTIVYTFNFNDIHPAMAGTLVLLTDSQRRFASLEQYDGWRGQLKEFGKDHWKTLYVAKDLYGRLLGLDAEARSRPQTDEQENQGAGATLCYQEASLQAQDDAFQKPDRLWKRMYVDPDLQAKLRATLRSMRDVSERGGSHLLLAVNYDLLLLEQGTDTQYKAIIEDAARAAGITVIATHDLFREHFRTCGFFGDPRHLGSVGSKLYAARLQESLQGVASAVPSKRL